MVISFYDYKFAFHKCLLIFKDGRNQNVHLNLIYVNDCSQSVKTIKEHLYILIIIEDATQTIC